MVQANYEFAGIRSQMFREALSQYPAARRDDIELMRQHLEPRPGDHILGFGEGSGFFCRAIAEAVTPAGRYLITDPSPEQMQDIPADTLALPQVETMVMPAEGLRLPPASFDKVWACAAFHHCPDQTQAVANIYRALKPGGRLVLFDVFQGTPLARHFDAFIARYCATGHEVKFLSEEFARTLCVLAGFDEDNVSIVNVPHRLCFRSELDAGRFVYKMHALTLMPGDDEQRSRQTLASLKRHLPLERSGDTYVLHYDEKGLIAFK